MSTKNLISIQQVCKQYDIEISFIDSLIDYGLIETQPDDQYTYIEQEHIRDLERMIRLHHDLGVNLEGIDIITNLINRIENLQNQLHSIENRLRLYEDL